jgi:hypothetical protein
MGSDSAEMTDGLETEPMGFLEMSSESGTIIKSSNAQGALIKA